MDFIKRRLEEVNAAWNDQWNSVIYGIGMWSARHVSLE
jgi:hypothetical protein